MLVGKKILLAVCGSIAAYKTAFFVRLLVKAGAEVKVIMTESATHFITPLTLATVSKNPVFNTFYGENGTWNNHVNLGLWADLMIVAPMSANTLSKFANGGCDNLVTATYLSAKCPVMVCPAMDLDMYQHPTTKKNLHTLQTNGNIIIEATFGELASGLTGEGRMAEPETLIERIQEHFTESNVLAGRKVLITSGPTNEAIDPVRFIGNHSTGKMGKAIAMELARRGASVEFITGPVASLPNHPNIKITKIKSAMEMLDAAKAVFNASDVAIFAAAVADYRPKEISDSKIKKRDQNLELTLVPNPDIAFELGQLKQKQLNVGFALETDNETENALGKLKRKNFDFIVLNSLQNEGAGFAHDTNQISVFDKHNNATHFELKDKEAVAKDLVQIIQEALNA
jgi:phosphopantothenoylcysteine decarboxylase/phosphopantothenate--cysteine ligase